MRPYFAIIKDSFREALASRVLWVLLLMITLLLVALIPFHWQSTIAAELMGQDVRNTRNLAALLKSSEEEGADPVTKHVWNSLDGETQKRVRELKDARGGRSFVVREKLVERFNKVIERDDFYQPDIWADSPLSDRAKELQSSGNLKGDTLKQFNRLALESALPGQLRPCPDEAVMFRYAKWDLDFVPPLRRKFATEMIDNVLMAFMALFVGFFGIFAGVLVTAPIMPNMLNSGSLYVLLSKPVSRPLTFISKFLGGCSFVLINAAYLIVGLWLILGMRFGIWKPTLLWSIPIFLFSFAIFYSVSALSGVVWRSAVMAIVATVLFWFCCKAVSTTKDVIEQFVVVPDKITEIIATGEETFVARRNGGLAHFNRATNSFDTIFERPEDKKGGGPEAMMGPTSTFEGISFESESGQLIALDRRWSQANLITGSKENAYRRDPPKPAPPNAHGLFRLDGRLITVGDNGVYVVSGGSTIAAKPKNEVADDVDGEEEPKGINIFGIIKIPAPNTKPAKTEEPTEEVDARISDDIGPLPGDARIAFNESTKEIWIYGSRKLRKLSYQNGRYSETNSADLPELSEVTDIAAGGDVVAIANRKDDMTVLHVFDASTLDSRRVIETGDEDEVHTLDVSDDGRWVACLLKDESLAVYNLLEMKEQPRKRFSSQGSISAMQFNGDAMTIVDSNDRVMQLSLPDMKQQEALNPKLPIVRKLYRYLVRPLYLVFPKPAELQNTMTYAITGKETVKVGGPGMGPGGRTIKLRPWEPLISNSIFIVVMLFVGCFYVYRQDF